jgi:SMI1/KNR4 family protein SUKH-1
MLEGRSWYSVAGALPETIQELRSAAPSELPESYVALLSFSDGGEGSLSVQPYNLVLDPVREVISRISNRNYGQPEFDGFLIFGGNGGGEYLAFDTRQGTPWPVVSIDMVAGRDSAEQVASISIASST